MTELNFTEMWKERQLESFEGEIWKQCTESAFYEISNYGRIKQIGSITKSTKPIPRITPQRLDKKGYCNCSLITNDSKKSKGFKVHRLVAYCFIENPLNLEQVNHKTGIKTINNSVNLEWITNKDNMQHSYDIGLRNDIVKGENNPRALLKEDEVIYIYTNPDRLTTKELSEKFKINRHTLGGIYSKKNWSYLTKNLERNIIDSKDRFYKIVDLNTGFVYHAYKSNKVNEITGIPKEYIKTKIDKKETYKNRWSIEYVSYDEYKSNKVPDSHD